jgi:hypothetical protein
MVPEKWETVSAFTGRGNHVASHLIRTWIEALRSGWYEQGFGALHQKDGCFCVVGVLVDVYLKQEELDWEWNETCNKYLYPNALATAKFPSPIKTLIQERKKIEFLFFPQTIIDPALFINMNDNARLSFGELADFLEAVYL